MKIRHITETTAGATASGSVASVAKPLGKMQERTNVAGLQPAEKVMKGKAKKKGPYGNSIVEGKMKDLAYDLQYMDNGNFKKKYGKTKEEVRASLKEGKGLADKIAGKLKKNVEKSNKEKKDTEAKVKQHQQDQKDKVSEAELSEADLIVMPGMRRMKDTSFIPHKADRRDHEVEMARSDLYAAAKDAMRIFKILKDRSEEDGLMGWQQSYITLAADYLNSVADSIEYNAQVKGNLDEMTGGVLAGGMSNFEEGRYYNPMDDERREQAAMDAERRDFKRREMDAELGHEQNNYAVAIDGRTWKVFGDKQQAENIARSLRRKGKKAEVYVTGASVSEAKEHKCPKCGGEMVSEELMNEKKDACYYKVKSRYKVWPSAYASGALVKCRKKGSKNWGKGKKK